MLKQIHHKTLVVVVVVVVAAAAAVVVTANKITQNKHLMEIYTIHLYTPSQKLPTVFKLKTEKGRQHKEVVHISTTVSEKLAALVFRIFSLKTKPASSFKTPVNFY